MLFDLRGLRISSNLEKENSIIIEFFQGFKKIT